MKIDPSTFYYHLQNHMLYTTMKRLLRSADQPGAAGDEASRLVAVDVEEKLRPYYAASLRYHNELPSAAGDESLRDMALASYLEGLEAMTQEPPAEDEIAPLKEDFARGIASWRADAARYAAGAMPDMEALPDPPPPEAVPPESIGDPGAFLRGLEGKGLARSGPRAHPRDLFPVHSSAPVYDIGETIARGLFALPEGARFPTADIIGKTEGRIELLPFWDHKNNRPLSEQSVNLLAGADLAEFSRMQQEAINISTSYNEEMATYFYAMDAYWLSTAAGPDDFVELQVAEIMRFTGKKPVKTHGKYTGTFRRDQLQRAGMMVYGMGFSMVEIEKTIIKGVGERTHYKRLWDVSDIYVMTTLDGEKYIETITYRPNEFFRSVSFGARRETALLMAKVLGLDYDKMVAARRLGRYYTWLWRDRAHGGGIDAPIRCKTLLSRAGIEPEKGKERFARRSLEAALDRLETEGIIAQWVLLEEGGAPADTAERVPFPRWLEMKIAVTPPDVILSHYAAGIPAANARGAGQEGAAGIDIAALKAAREKRGLTLSQLSEETGVELSTLSRILAGKTKRPRAEHVKAIKAWMAGQK